MTPEISIPTQNLLIPQGDDFEVKYLFCHGTRVLYDVPPSTVPIRIYIAPIGASMTIGQKLKHEGGELILAEPIAPTDVSAMVTRVPFKLLKNTSIAGNPINVTGWTGLSSIRSALGSPSFWQAACTIDSAVNGTFSILFPRLSTQLIPSSCSISQLKEIPNFKLQDALTWGKLIKKSYFWEFDTIDTQDRRITRVSGRVLIGGVTG